MNLCSEFALALRVLNFQQLGVRVQSCYPECQFESVTQSCQQGLHRQIWSLLNRQHTHCLHDSILQFSSESLFEVFMSLLLSLTISVSS